MPALHAPLIVPVGAQVQRRFGSHCAPLPIGGRGRAFIVFRIMSKHRGTVAFDDVESYRGSGVSQPKVLSTI
jgi:hypothetical protein